jgi:hypothetical protein
MPKMIQRGPTVIYARKASQIGFDRRRRPMPIAKINTEHPIRKYGLIGSGMNGTGAFTNTSGGHDVKIANRPIDWRTNRNASGRTLVLNAFSGVDVLKRSNKLSLDCIDLLTLLIDGKFSTYQPSGKYPLDFSMC